MAMTRHPTPSGFAAEVGDVVVTTVPSRPVGNGNANHSFVTPSTLECYVGNIYAKFGAKGRQQSRRALAASGMSVSVSAG